MGVSYEYGCELDRIAQKMAEPPARAWPPIENGCGKFSPSGSGSKALRSPLRTRSDPTQTYSCRWSKRFRENYTDFRRKIFREIPLLDPDNIARTLQSSMPSTFPIAAARRVLKSAKEHISRGESFAVETTLAGKHYLQNDG